MTQKKKKYSKYTFLGNDSTESYENIDEGFLDILQTLNDKGYRTVYCCEGHERDVVRPSSRITVYLVFYEDYKFDVPVPDMFAKNKSKNYLGYGEKRLSTSISKGKNARPEAAYYWHSSTKGSVEDKMKEREKYMADIKKWSEELSPFTVLPEMNKKIYTMYVSLKSKTQYMIDPDMEKERQILSDIVERWGEKAAFKESDHFHYDYKGDVQICKGINVTVKCDEEIAHCIAEDIKKAFKIPKLPVDWREEYWL